MISSFGRGFDSLQLHKLAKPLIFSGFYFKNNCMFLSISVFVHNRQKTNQRWEEKRQ